MCIRLLQGVFAGAIGVGRGNVVTITDPSNEGRAYAILGFCWGFGGVAGAIIGGSCAFQQLFHLVCVVINFSVERPAEKWPSISVTNQVSLYSSYYLEEEEKNQKY